MVRFGLDTWYFITVDYVFGWQLEQDASAAIERAGGRVFGHSRHPLNAKSFLEYLDAAQDSGAKVIALGSAGSDTINAVRQAAEIGISPRSQTLVPLLVFISDVHTLGLDVAKGMTFIDGFYWDADDQTRAWSKHFFERRKVMPTMSHAGVYSCVLHYLRAVRAAGTDEAKAVASKMRQLRVDDFFAKGGEIRADGRSFTICILSRSKLPRTCGGRGIITKSSQLSLATKPSDHSVKANAILSLRSYALGTMTVAPAQVSAVREQPSATRADFRFGVAFRLLIAFAAITAFAVAVSAVALFTFGKYEKGFTRIASSNLPALVAASDLAQRSQALAANAPNLAVVDGHFARRAVSESLRNQLLAIAEASAQVKNWRRQLQG